MRRKPLKSITIAAVTMVLLSASVEIRLTYAAEPKKFADFPATETFNGTPSKIDTSQFEGIQTWVHEHINRTISEGPNFAGAYSLVWIPCGTNCVVAFAFSLRDGNIIWLPTSPAGVSYVENSRLVIAEEYLGDEDYIDQYYVLENDTFRKIEN